MTEAHKCEICGDPMPPGEEIFKFHGYSGQCPKPPLPRPPNEVARLRGLLSEFIKLCELGDVDETTEAYGWGDLITRAKLELTPNAQGKRAAESGSGLGAELGGKTKDRT